MQAIRDPRNFWAGTLFLTLGIGALLIGGDYQFGSAGRMGPGYFPIILGAMLTLIGAAVLIRSLLQRGEVIGRLAYRELGLVLGAVVAFALTFRGAGLAPAVVLLVLISGFASKEFRLRPYLMLAGGLAVFSVLVFIKGLGLPLAIFGPWFGA